MEQVATIKRNALIDLTFGGEIISRLQRSLMHLTQSLSEKESNDLRNKLSSNQPLTESENVIATLSTIILAIENKAKETNQIEYRTVEDAFTPHP